MKCFAGFNNFNLSKDIYDPAKFNNYPNVDLNNKPFACGELATSGSIQDPDNPTQSVTTCQYYNNYDISHHNEIWGSAFIGNFHSGFTWFTEVAHRYENSNPFPKLNPGTARNKGDPFTFKNISNVDIDINGNATLTITDYIKTTYHNFKPFYDFIETIKLLGIDLNDFWIPRSNYNSVEGIECYYQTNTSESSCFGWVHNNNFYWANKYYYWVNITPPAIPYYNLNGCISPTLGNGLTLEGFSPGYNYDISFYMTRMANPPPLFPASVQLQADISGHIILDGSLLGYLGCDTLTADFAFMAKRLPNRPGENEKTEIQKHDTSNYSSFSIFPNPNNGKFSIYFNKNVGDLQYYKIRIYDITGRLIEERISNSENIEIDLYYYPKGCYILSIISNNHQYNKKIIIQ